MPTYVYQCSTCEKVFEAEQRITAEPLTDCDCGAKNSLKRVIQPIAVMFKGSGFHINDYAASTATKPAEGAASGESKAADTASKPSDTKTESPATPASTDSTSSAPATSTSTETKS